MPKANGVRCLKCNTVRGLEARDDGLIVTRGLTCPNGCAGKTFEEVFISPYWFDMAVAFGYQRTISAAALIRDFYEIWDTNMYKTFADFMQAEVLGV